jgi:hypothetical protein
MSDFSDYESLSLLELLASFDFRLFLSPPPPTPEDESILEKPLEFFFISYLS